MTRCESPKCGRRIVWRPHVETGRMAPVDPVPNDQGNVVLEGDAYRVLRKDEIARYDNPGMLDGPVPDRFTLHFATCPDADHFRRDHKAHRDRSNPR